MSDETTLRDAVERGLRSCRHQGAPARLIQEGDLLHATHMVTLAVEAWVGARLAGADADVARAVTAADDSAYANGQPSASMDETVAAALTAVRDALGVATRAGMRPGATETAPGAPNPGSGVSQAPRTEFDRSNEVEAATCGACPFGACPTCPAEAANRAMLEAE